MSIQATFILMHETKGALRYQERLQNGALAQYPNSPGAIIGTLYVRKTAFKNHNENYPKQITVTVDQE